MISAYQPLSQDRLLRAAQFSALLLASVVVVTFIRFHLVSSARSFREDFERQSFIELSRGETFMVARKLAALGKSEQFSCISATKSGILFFEEKNGTCDSGFFIVKETVLEPNHQMEIVFTIRLQSSLFWGLILFLLAQLLMAATVYLSQLRLNFLRVEGDLAVAALAQQVAHDLQSPLAVLATYKDGGAWNSERRSLHSRAVERLRQLVGRLQGEKVGTQNSGSVAALLSQVAQEKEVEWRASGNPLVQIVWKEPLGNCRLAGEDLEWRRVLSNLLNNALEASGPGSKVLLEVCSQSQGKISLSVVDEGRGIPSSVLRKLGSSGFTYGKAKGKGIGFYLARRYVNSLGGEIDVKSIEGRGTTVKLIIPASESKSAILVDDNADLALAWRLAGEKRGVTLQHYLTLDEFLDARNGLPKDTPIYLDLEFPSGSKSSLEVGEILARDGFTNVSISTGRPKSSVPKPAWATAVLSKDPPWLP